MWDLMKYKYFYFIVSLLVIIPGVLSLYRYGLKLSIDFTGGSLLEVRSEESVKLDKTITLQNNNESLKKIFDSVNIKNYSIQSTSDKSYLIRTKSMDAKQKDDLINRLDEAIGGIKETRFETVGPVIGRELTIKAFQSVFVASLAIILYITYSFRHIPKPYSAWKFGVSAVFALLHDVLVVVGIFSLLGHFQGVEIDSLFVTALLTVIGFSVHDTIVVFDRVRENLAKMSDHSFESVVNTSLVQTLHRSLSTSLTVLLVLLALILFGGESIRWFVIALFIGIFSGTYSSIFNAAPLLVIWQSKVK